MFVNDYRDDLVTDVDPATLTEREWAMVVERNGIAFHDDPETGETEILGFRRDVFAECLGADWEAEVHADR